MNRFFKKIFESKGAKKILYAFIGIFTYPGINLINRLEIEGLEKLHSLPKKNVLFVSNHQTYFADVITFIHIFCAARWGRKKTLGIPFYLLWPFTSIKYVAAATTMNSSFISKVFTLAGAITVKRAWNQQTGEKIVGLETGETRTIGNALQNNWVITFPQGTTTAYASGRKGTAFIISHYQPIVVPIVIDGFSDVFSKSGLKMKKWGGKLKVRFKDPMQIDFSQSTEIILQQVMQAIEQIKE